MEVIGLVLLPIKELRKKVLSKRTIMRTSLRNRSLRKASMGMKICHTTTHETSMRTKVHISLKLKHTSLAILFVPLELLYVVVAKRNFVLRIYSTNTYAVRSVTCQSLPNNPYRSLLILWILSLPQPPNHHYLVLR